ncbi:hypothetical protein MRS44_004723 [Fusarium solani]|uniref:uncharacterized protein n=1 Tax=Fusarium solani TaxID=169388 RepID=UPI0032C458BD|nr:hypothetical protein MRS44_004723 [Fusarium solani]
MASSLPTFPRVVFTTVEPISLVAGFLGAVIDPAWFIGEQVLQKDGIATSEGSIVVAWQLGNLYLLLAFIGIAVLSTTSENKVVRAYLVALWLGDVGHIGFSCYGLGWGKLVRPVEWNAMAWGNIAMTLQHLTVSLRLLQLIASMETRSYAKRAGRYAPAPAPSLPPMATRHRGINPLSSSPRKSQSTQESKGKLLRDPVARRNAPVDTASIASIATEPSRVDDETEFGEDEKFVEDVKPAEGREYVESSIYSDEEGASFEDHSEEIRVGLEANDARRKILELSIPDLCRAADDLMEYIGKRDTDPDVFHGRLAIKRRAFQSVRAEYEEEDTAPFIDWAPFLSESAALARVNVVTAFDKLCDFNPDNEREMASFLTTLWPLFPAWFVLEQSMFQEPETMLDLRTWLFIESFSRQTGETDYKRLIASIFCKDEGKGKINYAQLFAGGHFLELGGEGEDHDELCSARVSEIVNIVHKKKAGEAISLLREKFGLDQLIPELQSTFKALYKILKPAEKQASIQLDTRAFTPYEHQQESMSMMGSQADDLASESQSIIRAGTGEAEPSLFVGQESIRALQEGNRRESTVPPSNQQLVVPGRNAPLDYPDHQNTDLLLRDSLPPPQPKKKRPGPVKLIRREEPRGLMGPPPPKKSRVQQSVPDSQPSPSQTPDPSPTAPPQSSAANLRAVDERYAEMALQNRLNSSQGPQKRIPWTEPDSNMLIELIAECHCGWSVIERRGKERFEIPRNQQACRDKARNLKVQFLLTDRNLPPLFDEVALGPKEVMKVQSHGKNPFRRVADVDGDGRPIGTEFRTASMETF